MNNKSSNIIDALKKSSKVKKGIYFYKHNNEEEYLSYREILSESTSLLISLNNSNIKKGDYVVFQINDIKSFIINFWACVLGGIIPVPLSVSQSSEYFSKTIKVWRQLDKTWLLTDDRNLLSKLSNELKENTDLERLNDKIIDINNIEKIDGSVDFYEPKCDDTLFIQYSSGSTGKPKGVIITHRNIFSNINAIINGSEVVDKDKSINWMPLTHDMGLIGFHIAPLFRAIDQFQIPPNLFVRKPSFLLDLVHKHKISILGAPNSGLKHIIRMLNNKITQFWDLSHVRLLYVGAEVIQPKIIFEFCSKLYKYGFKENAIFPVYGLAEASLAVTFPNPNSLIEVIHVDRQCLNLDQSVNINPGIKDSVELIKLGKPVDDCNVKILSTSGTVLDENIIGKIYIKGKNVSNGYYKKISENRLNEWLYTGDIGFFSDNQLVVIGREKDVTQIHGQNIYLYDLENFILKNNDFSKYTIIAASTSPYMQEKSELIIFIKYRKSLDDFILLSDKIRSYLLNHLGLIVSSIIPVKEIFKTSSGKIKRYKLIDRYINGYYDDKLEEINKEINLKVEESYEKDEIEKFLTTICWKYLGIRNVSVNSNILNLNLSSLAIAQLFTIIADKYNQVITISDLFNSQSLNDLANTIKSRINNVNQTPKNDVNTILKGIEENNYSIEDIVEDLSKI